MFSTGRKVLSLAVVAMTAWLAIPLIAQAQSGAGSAQAPDAFARAVARHTTIVAAPNDRGGQLGIGAQTTVTAAGPDAFARAVARHTTTVAAPNDRSGQLGIGAQTTATAAGPDAFERAVARHEATLAGSTTSLSTNSSSTIWMTVGLVALGIALALALAAAARLISRRQLAHS